MRKPKRRSEARVNEETTKQERANEWKKTVKNERRAIISEEPIRSERAEDSEQLQT